MKPIAALFCALYLIAGLAGCAAAPEAETTVATAPTPIPTAESVETEPSVTEASEATETTTAPTADTTPVYTFTPPEGLTLEQALIWNAMCHYRIQDSSRPDAAVAHAAEYTLEHPELGHISLLLILTDADPDSGTVGAIAVDLADNAIFFANNFQWPTSDTYTREELITIIANAYEPYLLGISADLWQPEETLVPLSEADITTINDALTTN